MNANTLTAQPHGKSPSDNTTPTHKLISTPEALRQNNAPTFAAITKQQPTNTNNTRNSTPLRNSATNLLNTLNFDQTLDIHLEQTNDTQNNTNPNEWNTVNRNKKTNKKENRTQRIIIDNSDTPYTKPQKEKFITDELGTHIEKIETLKKGGIIITPTDNKALNKILKHTFSQEKLGANLYIHLDGDEKDNRPWLCLNKINYEEDTEQETLELIKNELQSKTDALTGDNIKIEALHRKLNKDKPTTLILFKTQNKINQDTLTTTDNKITHRFQSHTIRLYINKQHTQCGKCQRLGHHTRECKKTKHTCVRCAGDCLPMKCTNGNKRHCVNCGGNHPSTFYRCAEIVKLRKHNYHNQINTNYTNNLKKEIKRNKDEQIRKSKQLEETNHQTEQKQKQINEKIQQHEKKLEEYNKTQTNQIKKNCLKMGAATQLNTNTIAQQLQRLSTLTETITQILKTLNDNNIDVTPIMINFENKLKEYNLKENNDQQNV